MNHGKVVEMHLSHQALQILIMLRQLLPPLFRGYVNERGRADVFRHLGTDICHLCLC